MAKASPARPKTDTPPTPPRSSPAPKPQAAPAPAPAIPVVDCGSGGRDYIVKIIGNRSPVSLDPLYRVTNAGDEGAAISAVCNDRKVPGRLLTYRVTAAE